MKYFLLIIFCLFFTSTLKSQPFEGKLVYIFSIDAIDTNILGNFSKEVFLEEMRKDKSFSDTSIYYFKQNGDYRLEVGAGSSIWSIYKSDSSKIFGFAKESNTVSIHITDKNYRSDIEIEEPKYFVTDVQDSICGKKCKVVKVIWNDKEIYYYYAPNFLPTDPTRFKSHIYEGFAEFTRISKCLPIKKTIISNGSTFSITLVDFQEYTLKPSLFHIPMLKDCKSIFDGIIENQKTMKIVKQKKVKKNT